MGIPQFDITGLPGTELKHLCILGRKYNSQIGSLLETVSKIFEFLFRDKFTTTQTAKYFALQLDTDTEVAAPTGMKNRFR